ncbi:SusF/SusE family outer membrane protein [Weeksellaceae bacterium A-14]
MKNIFKFLLVAVVAVLALASCEDEANRDWTSPEPSFKLYDTTLGTNVLYETMKDNPFTLTWDNSLNASGGYTIVVSATDTFENKAELGNTDKTTFTTTIGALNTAMLQAGLSPYSSQKAYIRIETSGGSVVSNAINFDVTTYPVTGPVITAPVTSSELVLDPNNPEAEAATVKWSDYTKYGVDVEYLVEIAKKGEETFTTAGKVKNETSLVWSNYDFNDAALKAGAQAGVENEMDLRVTATTVSVGGTITIHSAVVTVKVTPYATFTPLFLIGDATAAGWDNLPDNIKMFPLLASATNVNAYTFTGYFKAGSFKIVKEKGSWDTQYGYAAAGTLSTNGENIPVPAAGYYKLSIDVGKLTYTLDAISEPSNSYPTIGIIGNATPNGWDGSTPMVQSSVDPHMWYLANITLSSGEMKFRANNSWDVNWGSKIPVFGTGTQGGDNIPVEAGVYDVYFNDYSGAYTFIAK